MINIYRSPLSLMSPVLRPLVDFFLLFAVAIMETRAHNSQRYLQPGQMSLSQTDLQGGCQDFDVQGNMLRRISLKGRKPHVCIVGAGMAGLRCAQVLADRGLKVTMFEARDRLGGRVCSPRSLSCWTLILDSDVGLPF